jgi:hypothetical protein
MAKAPRPGRVKTRLAESLSSTAVIALYRCLLEDTLDLAKRLRGVEAVVVCPGADQEELAELIGQRAPVVAQKGEGLAAGLAFVFRHFTAGGGQRVIAFNSDSPHLSPTVLEGAFEILALHDLVVGPTNDGGYYLVGAKGEHPTLFESDGLGTKSALERLLERTKGLGLSTGFSERFYDIDVADDLVQLGRELQLSPARAPRTAQWLSEWRPTGGQLGHQAGGQ